MTVALCSNGSTCSLDCTVTSVLWVTKDFGLKGCTIGALLPSMIEPQDDSVAVDLPVHPENTEPENDKQLHVNGTTHTNHQTGCLSDPSRTEALRRKNPPASCFWLVQEFPKGMSRLKYLYSWRSCEIS